MSAPSLPKGTRDFSPLEMARRNYIFDTIKSVFVLYGYQPIETPAMENLSTLMGKYGEEGDKLLFKILNSGDFLKGVDDSILAEKLSNKALKKLSEKGLRYDLTVPFARYVVQHRNELTFPFKRYQVQPVWRADRPQKGRYREFYQCDVDVIGSDSLLNEVELIRIADQVFKRLGIEVIIKINNRKILSGIAEELGASEMVTDITIAIDKMEKIGVDEVNRELQAKGLTEEAVRKLQPILHLQGSNREKLDKLSVILGNSVIGMKGIEEVRKVLAYTDELLPGTELLLDLTLARGLNYYTGAIIEVKARNIQMGSISGGGRYDDLTGIFGMPGVPGVGISFGADRIYDVLQELHLFPEATIHATRVLLVNFGGNEELVSLKFLARLQEEGISAELYPSPDKMKKQFTYADSKKIPFALIIGSEESTSGFYQLKNMNSGEQGKYTPLEIIEKLKSSL